MRKTGMVVGVVAAVIVAVGSRENSEPGRQGPTAVVTASPSDEWLVDLPGLEVRQLFRPDQVNVPDEISVIGVVVDGEARAYLKAGMGAPESHLAYDRIGQADIAVAFCSRTRRSRVFVGDSDVIHSIRVGGWKDEDMQLLVGENRFALSAKDTGFGEPEYQSISWGEWRRAHPDTLLYLGDLKAHYAIGIGRAKSDRRG